MATKVTLMEHARTITQSRNHDLDGWITVASMS